MDHDRQELVAINDEINNLLRRLRETNWKKEVTEPAAEKLEEASVALYAARVKVDAL